MLLDPNIENIINHYDKPNSNKSEDKSKINLAKVNNSSVSYFTERLVPTEYRIKVPKLVWESKKITWHGHAYPLVERALKEALCDNLTETAIIHMVELVASGYSAELWDALWETLFIQGLIFSEPSLANYFLSEYNLLLNIKKRLTKHNLDSELINNQVYRNHITELLTIFCIYEHHPNLINDFNNHQSLSSGIGLNLGVDLIMEPIKDGVARSLSQEYILMSKTDSNSCVELQELHYNLAKFFESIRLLKDLKDLENLELQEADDKNTKNKNIENNAPKYEQTFFWIHEIVKMTDIKLKSNLQNYLPRQEEEWTCHPTNILWNYLFIRAPNKIWSLLATLMEIFTINFKRKQTIVCSTILLNVLQIINDDSFLENYVLNQPYIRSRHPLVIQNVLKVNEIFLLSQN